VIESSSATECAAALDMEIVPPHDETCDVCAACTSHGRRRRIESISLPTHRGVSPWAPPSPGPGGAVGRGASGRDEVPAARAFQLPQPQGWLQRRHSRLLVRSARADARGTSSPEWPDVDVPHRPEGPWSLHPRGDNRGSNRLVPVLTPKMPIRPSRFGRARRGDSRVRHRASGSRLVAWASCRRSRRRGARRHRARPGRPSAAARRRGRAPAACGRA
jgi:hypothetical protein